MLTQEIKDNLSQLNSLNLIIFAKNHFPNKVAFTSSRDYGLVPLGEIIQSITGVGQTPCSGVLGLLVLEKSNDLWGHTGWKAVQPGRDALPGSTGRDVGSIVRQTWVHSPATTTEYWDLGRDTQHPWLSIFSFVKGGNICSSLTGLL